MSIDKDLSRIVEADLVALTTAGVSEGKTIEFKRAINLASDDAKRKFLATVVSFANTQGGDIVFGMEADKGVAKALQPLPNFDPDADCIRLRDLIRAHIEPKPYGFHFQPVPLAIGSHALVLRIPRTWVGAHMVTYGHDNRFYVRDGNGKRLMDVGEVRMAFSAAETFPERLRRLRLDRLSAIASGDAPTPLASPQALVLHIAPVRAFDALHECDLDAVAAAEDKGHNNLLPIPHCSHGMTYDIDGLLCEAEYRQVCHGYTKLFRTGLLEALDCSSVCETANPTPTTTMTFAPAVYEKHVLWQFPKWLEAMRVARIEPPAFVALSFIGMVGRFPYVGPSYSGGGLRPIRHDPLLLPPSLLESLEVDAKPFLLQLFNRLWQACGWPRTINFDENGNFRYR